MLLIKLYKYLVIIVVITITVCLLVINPVLVVHLTDVSGNGSEYSEGEYFVRVNFEDVSDENSTYIESVFGTCLIESYVNDTWSLFETIDIFNGSGVSTKKVCLGDLLLFTPSIGYSVTSKATTVNVASIVGEYYTVTILVFI